MFREGKRKQVNLKAGLLILLLEVCTSGVEPREAPEKAQAPKQKVITCPYFISSFQKQCFPGLEKCHILLPFPKATAATFYHCILVLALCSVRWDWDITSLLPTQEATQIWTGGKSYAKGFTRGSKPILISLIVSSPKPIRSDYKI